jgi:hypothetical protein
VCATCHSSHFSEDFPSCFPCNDTGRKLDHVTADVVASISLAPSNEQLARNLYCYKDERLTLAVRKPHVVGLAAVTYKWRHLHKRCLATAAGIPARSLDVLTALPSTRGRVGTHPLVTLFTEVVVGSKDRYADLLVVNRPDLGAR